MGLISRVSSRTYRRITMSHVDDAKNAVFVKGDESNLPTAEKIVVKGFDWDSPDNKLQDGGIDYKKLLDSYLTTGFQSTNMGLGMEQIKEMIDAKVNGSYGRVRNC